MLIVDTLKTHYADPSISGLIETETIAEMVKVTRMFREVAYARALNNGRVKRLVEHWDTDSCDILVVSLRDSGMYAIIDGCHRHRAAELRGIEQLPARVFVDLTIQREAQLFVHLNRDRSAPSAMDVYRGRLAAEEPAAQDLRSVVQLAHYDIAVEGHGVGRIDAVTALEAVYESIGPQGLLEVLRIIRDAWGDDRPRALHGHMLTGLGAFWMRYRTTVNRGRLVDRLTMATPEMVLAESQSYRTIKTGVTAPSAVGRTVVDKYNHGLPATKRLNEWQERGVYGPGRSPAHMRKQNQQQREQQQEPGS